MTTNVRRRAVRRELDFYETAPWQTRALLKWHPVITGRIFEPCAGKGAISKLLAGYGATVTTNDVDARRSTDYHADALLADTWQAWRTAGLRFEWIVTNPPFFGAIQIAQHARFYYPTTGLALLVRRSWLEPTEDRGPWLARNPPQRAIVLPRHSFTTQYDEREDLLGTKLVRVPGGNDSMTCEWLVWDTWKNCQKRPPLVISPDAAAL